jgi:hypothetical protein
MGKGRLTSGVHPLESGALASLCALINDSNTACWPWLQAICRAVRPTLFFMAASAELNVGVAPAAVFPSSSAFTHATDPPFDAKCRAVFPTSSTASNLAPDFTSSTTTLSWKFSDANIRGDMPPHPREFGSALQSDSKYLQVSTSPVFAAWHNADIPAEYSDRYRHRDVQIPAQCM